MVIASLMYHIVKRWKTVPGVEGVRPLEQVADMDAQCKGREVSKCKHGSIVVSTLPCRHVVQCEPVPDPLRDDDPRTRSDFVLGNARVATALFIIV